MAKEADTSFQEVFSQASSTDLDQVATLVCLFCSFPSLHEPRAGHCCRDRKEDIPATTTAPKPECSQIPDPSDSPDLSNWNSISSSASLTGIFPLWELPWLGAHLLVSSPAPMQKKLDHSSSGTLSGHCNKQSHVDSQEV